MLDFFESISQPNHIKYRYSNHYSDFKAWFFIPFFRRMLMLELKITNAVFDYVSGGKLYMLKIFCLELLVHFAGKIINLKMNFLTLKFDFNNLLVLEKRFIR